MAATDPASHLGAGLLRYDEGRDELSGEYWTQRRADLGFNTAGTIVLRRVRAKKAPRRVPKRSLGGNAVGPSDTPFAHHEATAPSH